MKLQCIGKIIFKIIILNCLTVSKQRDKVPNDFKCLGYCLPLTCYECSTFSYSNVKHNPNFLHYSIQTGVGWG